MDSGGTSSQSETALWEVAARMHHRYLTGLILTVLQKKGAIAGTELNFRLFRAQHLEKFLPGLKSLGLDRLPHAVACAQYIYLANLAGGVDVQYMYESDRKAWVRYPPPRWIWEGTAICAVPTETSLAMTRGFHSHVGVSLGNPRLGFVVTKVTTDAEPGLEGYFVEGDRDLGDDERLTFSRDEDGPDFDPLAAPRLDWPAERHVKARRNYATQYIRTILPELVSLFGEDEAASIGRHAAYLIGMHTYHETASRLGITGHGPSDFASYLASIIRGSGDDARADGACVEAEGWRMMADKEDVTPACFIAWNGLWEGALAAHNRRLRLFVEDGSDSGRTIRRWHIRRPD